jgi:hypothetical protein
MCTVQTRYSIYQARFTPSFLTPNRIKGQTSDLSFRSDLIHWSIFSSDFRIGNSKHYRLCQMDTHTCKRISNGFRRRSGALNSSQPAPLIWKPPRGNQHGCFQHHGERRHCSPHRRHRWRHQRNCRAAYSHW